MLVDLENPQAPSRLDCDVCIVGAGAVGIVVAVNLARRGYRIAILEGGGVGLEQRSQNLYRTLSTGHPFKGMDVSRFRVLGGTTTFWGGQVIPFDPIVFESRPWVSDVHWPIEHKALESYYREAYRFTGLGEVELADSEVWRHLDVEPPHLGNGLEFTLTRWVPKRNFARLFKREIDRLDQLTAIVHANVTNFSTDESGKIVSGVHARTIAGKTITVRSRYVVLAGGTIENARLLLQPLHHDRVAPWAGNKWIGRGYLDHLDSTAGKVKILDFDRFHNLFDTIHSRGFMYYPKIRLSSASQRNEKLLDISAQFLYETPYGAHLEHMKLFIRSIFDGRVPSNISALPRHCFSVAKVSLPLILRYLRAHRSYKPNNADVRLELYCEQIPIADSTIRLAKSARDPLGMCCTEINWKIDGREIRTFASFARRIRESLGALGLASVTLDPDLDREDPAFFARVHDANHQMSSTRMAPTAEKGVVDTDLRIFGVKNFYVAGASVFPTTGFANPTFTAIALALRLCDHLNEKM